MTEITSAPVCHTSSTWPGGAVPHLPSALHVQHAVHRHHGMMLHDIVAHAYHVPLGCVLSLLFAHVDNIYP